MAKDYSQTIHIKSDFDVDSILKGLKQVEAALKQTTTSKGRLELAGVSGEIESLGTALKNLKTQVDKGFKNEGEVKTFTRDLDKAVNSINDVQASLQKVAITVEGAIGEETAKKIERFEKNIKDAKKSLKDFINTSFSSLKLDGQPKQKLIDTLMGGNIDQARKDLKKFYEEANKELDSLKKRAESNSITEATSKIINKATLFGRGRIGDKAIAENAIDKTQTIEDYKRLLQIETGFGSSVSDAIKNICASLAENIKAAISKTKLEDIIRTDYGKISDAVKASTGKFSIQDQKSIDNQENIVKNLETYYRDTEIWKALGEQINNTTGKVEAFTQKIQEANQAEQITNTALQQANVALEQQDSVIQDTTAAYGQFRNQLVQTATQQTAIDNGFAQIVNRLKYFASATTIFHYIRRAINQTYNDVKTLDKSFAQIAMVTKYTVNDMWRSYDQYAAMANKLGQATNDVIQASALYYQQGLDTAEALTLTEDTMKLATLASIDFAEATDLMTSALRGFKLEMDEGAHITDVYSELAAHAAANVQEIAVAMNKTSAIAASAGMSFENTAAFVTQMINFGPL